MTDATRRSGPDATQTLPGSKQGFFSRPVLVAAGPRAGKVLKTYAAVSSRELCDRLLRSHEQHVAQLRRIGIAVPETEMIAEEDRGRLRPVILQESFAEAELVKPRISRVELSEALDLMAGILGDALKAITHVHETGDDRFGFHPTLRNYAVRAGRLFYFDTFPPMSGFTRRELERLIPRFLPVRLPAPVLWLLRPYMRTVVDEYFRADVMLQGIVGSTCRLRPGDAPAIVARGREVVGSAPDFPKREAVLRHLRRPPRLGPLWMAGRRFFERARGIR
jgi:hypothetical protein